MIIDRQNAISLVDRLLALDTRIHELERENADLRARLQIAVLPSPAPTNPADTPPSDTRHILVVDLTTPVPDEDAGSQQTFLVLKSCLQAGLIVHFVPQGDWRFRPRDTAALQNLGIICAYAPYDTDFTSFMARMGARFAAILVFRAPVLEACLPAIRAYAPQAAILFHVADLHHLRLQRMADLTADHDLAAAAALMRLRELHLVAESHITITHSTAERDLLHAALPGAAVRVWPLMAEATATAKATAKATHSHTHRWLLTHFPTRVKHA
ncbi:MAG: hypothetical protein POH28_16580, partial [Acidocella sp.]|nr:hypothetical protein [Acidocella sp.]